MEESENRVNAEESAKHIISKIPKTMSSVKVGGREGSNNFSCITILRDI